MWLDREQSDQSGSLAQLSELTQRATNGDTAAFETLYKAYITPIYRFILFRVKRKEDAEDLTQLVFLKAFQSMERFEDRGVALLSWLYTIARNTVIDHWKKKKDVVVGDFNVVFENEPTTGHSPEDATFYKQTGERLLEEIGRLPEDQRDVLILRCVEDREYSEVARIMNKSEEAIRALKHRAVKNLEEVMRTNEQ